jgi:uncharacterized membrane protein
MVRADTLHALVFVLLLAGLGLSIYAWYESTHPAAQGSCSLSAFVSCAKVDQSGHTTTLGIPDYAFGVGGFALMLALDIPLYRTYLRRWLIALLGVSALGALLSVYLAGVELLVIQALCLVCTGTYLLNAAALVALLALYYQGRSGSVAEDTGARAAASADDS